MRNNMKKLFDPKLLVFLMIFTVSILLLPTDTVTAEAKSKNQYLIKVNRVYNTVTVYEKDEKGKYTVPVKVMLCSVGLNDQTLTGTFNTKEKYRWRELMGGVWGQYATRIVNGILFHSVYYYEKMNPATLATKEFNKLGKAASHGCIRLAVKDAKWIYDNCDIGTTVEIFDDKESPGPLGKPKSIKIASSVRWDPTDPDKKNPYLAMEPVISGVKSTKIAWGKSIDLKKGLKATSSVGTDITSKVKVKGEIDLTTPGKYKITYSVTDALNKTTTKKITVTVLNNTKKPKLEGVQDKVVASGTVVDSKFALSGIKVSCDGIKLKNNIIEVAIDKISDIEYNITYTVSVGNGPEIKETSKVVIDNEGPVFTGITDIIIDKDEPWDSTLALKNVTVRDNYTSPEEIQLEVSFEENEDGTYLVTYTATDTFGNVTKEQALIKYLAN